ncbi:hypothetical protein KAI87_11310 [Myxococcota bacterium]|nr:hypothetical protein [Myxococcota bacterium]
MAPTPDQAETQVLQRKNDEKNGVKNDESDAPVDNPNSMPTINPVKKSRSGALFWLLGSTVLLLTVGLVAFLLVDLEPTETSATADTTVNTTTANTPDSTAVAQAQPEAPAPQEVPTAAPVEAAPVEPAAVEAAPAEVEKATIKIKLTKKAFIWIDGEKLNAKKSKAETALIEPGSHEFKARFGKKFVKKKINVKPGETIILRFDARKKRVKVKRK